MRIVMVCPSYPPQDVVCGVGDYTKCLAEELVRQGEQVVVVTSTGYRGDSGGAVNVLPLGSRWSAVEGWKLIRSQRRQSADVIHMQYTPDLYGRRSSFALTPFVSRFLPRRAPVVVTFHTLIGGGLWSKVMAPWLLMMADRSISANEEVSDLIHRHLPALESRVTEIGIGSNIQVRAAGRDAVRRSERSRLGLPDGAPVLAHFGLVYPGKGLETLFQALPEILRQAPSARLIIIGATRPADQSYRAALEQLACARGIAHAVIWAGQHSAETVSRMLAAADLFVVPYDDGGTIRRGSLMAGLAHGLPVVTTPSPVPSSSLRDGVNVALVPPGDADALAKRVCALLASDDEQMRLRAGALALAEQFSWPAIAQRTRALYAQVLQS
jgi:glycosyltransferase involved in cell wall biosynthesis